jgi:hypothetical protein
MSCILIHACVFSVDCDTPIYITRWNLTKNGVFPLNSMYKALTILSQPILNNKFIWKMKIPLKTKVFLHGTFGLVLFLLKITLQNGIGMVVQNMFSVMKRRQ